MKIRSLPIAAGMLGVGLIFSHSPARAANPSIVITNPPAFGAQGNLSGLVLNANPATNSVAVYIYAAGGWYSKPTCASALTLIQPDGSWAADITTGGSDINATEIAAFLVPSNYTQGSVNGASGLPIPPEAEAVVYANRIDHAMRQFSFSGYDWSARTSSGLAGPGPNYFSDSTNNVWVDAQGALHLKITHANNQWQCAEIISDRSFGYGQYRFTVNAPVNSLDPNAVLGLFTWSNDSAYNDREIDIELSRWDYTFGTNNVEDYAISPYNTGQVFRFPLPANLTDSTHCFIWQSNGVTFQSLNGEFASPPASTNVLQNWNCAIGIPPAGGEQIHINLWLDKGNPPANNQPVEVVISKFEFVPLGPSQSARVNQLTSPANVAVELDAQGETDRNY